MDPRLAKMDARSDEEKKVKGAALFVKQLMTFFARRDSMKEEELKSIQAFLDGCNEPIEPKNRADENGNVLILYLVFNLGLTQEVMMKLLKSLPKE